MPIDLKKQYNYSEVFTKKGFFMKSKKDYIATVLLCFFLGTLGIHRFYVGKIGTGILMLLTMGGVGIWYIIDLVTIIVGKFKDKKGKSITHS